MGIGSKLALFASGVALSAQLGLAKIVQAEEYNPNGWPVPNISEAKLLGQKKKDIIAEIPGKETLLKGYKSPDGTFFNTLEYNGHLFGFYIDTNGKPPMEYTVLDQDGDGLFRNKYEYGIGHLPPSPKYLLANFEK